MNKTLIDELVRDFYTVSGMEIISIVDKNFHPLSIIRRDNSFCSLIHKRECTTDVCKASDIQMLNLAKDTSEPFLYPCPFGLIEAIVPVVRGDDIIAYIMVAIGLREGNENYALYSAENIAPDLGHDVLTDAVNRTRKYSEEEINAYFNMLKMLAEHIAADTTLIDSDESIGQLIKHYVKQNLSRKITLSDMAMHFYCSTVTLTEHFKREFGITINEYITKKRMEYAERLLRHTSEPLSEIASMSGYNDVEYFSRTFKKHHGASPSAWRKMNK